MIRTTDYLGHIQALRVPPKDRKLQAEVMALGHLVSDFAIQMLAKLAVKCKEGKRGWDDPDSYAYILDGLQEAVAHGEWVNVANYAAMLWNIESEKGAQDDAKP